MTVSVLVPSSICREAEDKREATRKLGYVARAATIFRADRLVVYPDRDGETGRFDGGFVSIVLRYAATPPYLRNEAWGCGTNWSTRASYRRSAPCHRPAPNLPVRGRQDKES